MKEERKIILFLVAIVLIVGIAIGVTNLSGMAVLSSVESSHVQKIMVGDIGRFEFTDLEVVLEVETSRIVGGYVGIKAQSIVSEVIPSAAEPGETVYKYFELSPELEISDYLESVKTIFAIDKSAFGKINDPKRVELRVYDGMQWKTLDTKKRTAHDANYYYETSADVFYPKYAIVMTGKCTERWVCEEWASCSITGMQERKCLEANSCGTTEYEPVMKKGCSEVVEEPVMEEPAEVVEKAVQVESQSTTRLAMLLIAAIVVLGIAAYYSKPKKSAPVRRRRTVKKKGGKKAAKRKKK